MLNDCVFINVVQAYPVEKSLISYMENQKPVVSYVPAPIIYVNTLLGTRKKMYLMYLMNLG